MVYSLEKIYNYLNEDKERMKDRIEYFDILRGVAIVFVVTIHSGSSIGPGPSIYT